MQILSNALPGFRDLRGPVIAGYMWLLFAWILTTPDLDTRPNGGVAEAFYNLGEHISRVGIIVAVSVAAYLVGSISQEASNALRGVVGWARGGTSFSIGGFRSRAS